jgi:hypothetical protein
MKLFSIILILFCSLCACSPRTNQKEKLTAVQVLEAFKKANLPVVDEIVYTEETDPNHLLNRPNQYKEKINFNDRRAANNESPRSNSIEVFQNAEDLDKRKIFVGAVTKSLASLSEYDFAHKNVLLRLNHLLTPAQAKEYETVLNSL